LMDIHPRTMFIPLGASAGHDHCSETSSVFISGLPRSGMELSPKFP
jgi:hypothetical protein